MRNTILFSIFILFMVSCKKDKYTTAPQLKYKSTNKKELRQGETLTMKLSFTDAEGDLLADSSLLVLKVVPRCTASSFSQYYRIPDFPTGKNQAGEIVITYTYNDINPKCNRNDTAVFKFVMRDKQKNKSDTAVSDQIIIYQ
jgi:hypothetical protein